MSDHKNPPKAAVQKSEFLSSEGDNWFARNRAALDAPSSLREKLVLRIAEQLLDSTTARVLEIGCGQGNNLARLSSHRPIRGFGVDPSPSAVAAGAQAFPTLSLNCGTADDLPFDDESFDMVWFGFCLYLVDRSLLMRAVAEADRVLCEGGLLVIVDFDPDIPCKRPYHHRHGMNSYKMNYSGLFLANPAYVLVEKTSVSHTTGGWELNPDERVSMTICRKLVEQAYRQT